MEVQDAIAIIQEHIEYIKSSDEYQDTPQNLKDDNRYYDNLSHALEMGIEALGKCISKPLLDVMNVGSVTIGTCPYCNNKVSGHYEPICRTCGQYIEW